MDESFGAGGFDNTNFGTGNVQAEARPEGIAPLLIQQILKMPDSGLSLYNMTFGMVTIVGIVRAIEHSSTKITYTLEDHTGRIEAHLWLEEGDALHAPNIVLNTYARVFGSMRVQGGGKTIMLFKISPVDSPNEVTTHLLEVLMTRYKSEDISNHGVRVPVVAGNSNGNVQENGHHAKEDQSHGLLGNEKLIFDAVKANKTDSGISRQELKSKYPNIQLGEIDKITEFLSAEGHIYTSIDSEHFLPTSE